MTHDIERFFNTAGPIKTDLHYYIDRTPGKSWDEKIWHEEREYNGRKIMVWGM